MEYKQLMAQILASSWKVKESFNLNFGKLNIDLVVQIDMSVFCGPIYVGGEGLILKHSGHCVR